MPAPDQPPVTSSRSRPVLARRMGRVAGRMGWDRRWRLRSRRVRRFLFVVAIALIVAEVLGGTCFDEPPRAPSAGRGTLGGHQPVEVADLVEAPE